MHRDVVGDMRVLQPNFIFSVPRLFDLAHGMFEDAIKSLIAAGSSPGWARSQAIKQFRSADGPFGMFDFRLILIDFD